MTTVALLLGANMGDVHSTLESVREALQCEVGAIVASSEVMRSEAWGFEAPDFLNQALLITTSLEPLALLDATQRIEERWGRERECEQRAKAESGAKYLSRSIDIDIILYGDQRVECERLTVPHPLMGEREFVLRPLAQVASEIVHPVSGRSIEEMLKDLSN
ncbi:MAG: 2-amino-4-hydroxy-6-hydroxymethyldihydropteridine diphosphokinase [Rikenellaceae bacterium]